MGPQSVTYITYATGRRWKSINKIDMYVMLGEEWGNVTSKDDIDRANQKQKKKNGIADDGSFSLFI